MYLDRPLTGLLTHCHTVEDARKTGALVADAVLEAYDEAFQDAANEGKFRSSLYIK